MSNLPQRAVRLATALLLTALAPAQAATRNVSGGVPEALAAVPGGATARC